LNEEQKLRSGAIVMYSLDRELDREVEMDKDINRDIKSLSEISRVTCTAGKIYIYLYIIYVYIYLTNYLS
jgi:hypothetical protein